MSDPDLQTTLADDVQGEIHKAAGTCFDPDVVAALKRRTHEPTALWKEHHPDRI